ncbi:efflux RND transporter permease subunit [Membranihabitans maritimus]|uniref:efflux RND transporter permease subunit n=1 Tax=Membranihabitans maritimus TaxID=2904244 RepID=UPI001F414C89|nr:efflux RND transporter permease subunit [Membranihabitans maritimus]
MSITELSVKRPTLIIVIFTILVFFGIFGYNNLNYELLPDIEPPVMSISTMYPGAGPGEVETSVTKEIEEELSSLENIESLQSISVEGFSVIMVELVYGTNVDVSIQEAQRKINAIKADLPEDVEEPAIDKFSLDDLPIMRIGATSDMDNVEFTNLFEQRIQPEIARIEGVAQVDIVGGEDREIAVNVSGTKLEYYNIPLLQVTQAITQANLNFPTGSVKNSDQDVMVRLSGKIRSLNTLRNLVIHTMPDGSQIFLSDVAEVYDTKVETQTISRLNGINSLGILISKQSDGNTVEVSRQIKEKIKTLEEQYADINLSFEIAQDSSEFTLEAANAVIHDLFLAVILVALIMLFFLHNLRNAVIVMVAIPISIVSTFALMSAAGFTLNLMTLLALSLVVGILVDDSIVVLENIHARMEKGATARQAAIDTWKEIGLSVSSITLVIVVVFLPIAFVQGIVADLLRQFALVVAGATLISLLVSFTLTPFLASRFTKLTHLNPKNWFHLPLIGFEKFLQYIQDGYRGLLKFTLKHKIITIIIIFGMVFSSFMLMTKGFIGSEFAASGDTGELIVEVELPKDSPIERTNQVTQQAEKLILSQTGVDRVFTTVGRVSSGFSSSSSPFQAELSVLLVGAEERSFSSEEFAYKIKQELQKNISGAEFKARPGDMIGAGGVPIQIILQSSDVEQLYSWSDTILNVVASVAGTSEVEKTVEDGTPEVRVDIDRQRMADLGLSLSQVGATMQNAFTGNTDTRLQDGQFEYDIRIQLDAFDRRNIEDVKSLTFANGQGKLVTLDQFAKVYEGTGPSQLDRLDKISSVTIESQVVNRPVGSVGEEIQAEIGNLDLPTGLNIKYAGDLENQAEAFGSLAFALLTSILLVYLIMVALYDNYIYPLVVMFSVPVAIIGALLALALALQNMSIFSMLGMIMLIGLVVKNAILIVDFANQLKREGMDSYTAIVEGTMQRFRPILMTTIAMVIAMIPIAVASGAGSEWKNGLAWVLIGGLTSSMILTIIIVPVVYRLVDQISEWWQKIMEKRRARKAIKNAELSSQ